MQFVPVQVGVMLRALDSRLHATFTVPLEWDIDVGTAWQSVQAIAVRIVPATRCAWCAPTPRAVTAVFPLRSAGGAAATSAFVRVASPWHDVQVWFARST